MNILLLLVVIICSTSATLARQASTRPQICKQENVRWGVLRHGYRHGFHDQWKFAFEYAARQSAGA